jgi:hypothetical protein
MKKQQKIERPLDISGGTRMNWLMKKTGYKKSRETVPLKGMELTLIYSLTQTVKKVGWWVG